MELIHEEIICELCKESKTAYCNIEVVVSLEKKPEMKKVCLACISGVSFYYVVNDTLKVNTGKH
jgi:hypothetical protein